ncbi:MAG: type ISP restriction/modification enzyme, partial [Gammaproteobacteria bacterium]
TEHLAWPENDGDANAWRAQWRAAFTLRHGQVVATSKELSIRLAKLAGDIRDRIKTALAIETDRGPLKKLMKAFQEALVHDLDAEGFADMYAQTIAYGLLSARIADPHKKTADDFAAHMRTNPFLKELMAAFLHVGGRRGKTGGPGIDFDELGVNEVMELLDDANMGAVVGDFGDRNPQEDPVIHFYELFLKEYDAKKRMQRGVFYTPRPVVSYIVRSVDELLRTEFGLADGLADTTNWREMAKRNKDLKIPDGVDPDQAFVQILDPATGTGTFLVEVIDLIHRRLTEKWKAQGHGEKKIEALWNEYVPKHLLPRLHGYELLMAPYAIAHLKIGLKLYETGYRFGSDERARVYLTNALEPASDSKAQMEFKEWIPALAHEAQAVNEIKRKQRFTVVIGNPPYSLVSANMEPAHRALVQRYKFLGTERIRERGALQLEKILNDDYVKFLARSEETLMAAGSGIAGLITNHAYLDNPTMRGLRYSLLTTFPLVYFYDLAGSTKKASQVDAADENVFDIQQGVAICLAVRNGNGPSRGYRYARVVGARDDKYARLAESSARHTQWASVHPAPKVYLLVPQDVGLQSEYERFIPLSEVFPLHSIGLFTSKDHLVISRDPVELVSNARRFRDSRLDNLRLCENLEINPKDAWDITKSRQQILHLTDADLAHTVLPFTHRPFDTKYIFYHRSLVWSMAYPVNRHLLRPGNIALVTSRQLAAPPWRHVFCSAGIVEMFLMSNKTKEGNHVFPLLVLPNGDSDQQGALAMEEVRANLSSGFLGTLAERLQFEQGSHMPPAGDAPRDVFHYVYAVLHSPVYRSRYAEFLKGEFPRVPVTVEPDLFRALVILGAEIVGLHVMKSPKLNNFITICTGSKNPEVARVGWSDNTVWLDAAATKKGQPATPGTMGFRGVSEEVWNFHIGGYQVCEKWLKDRKGRTLTNDDLAHYQKIVVALAETIRLMKEIDEVIEAHGGWPGAFQTVAETSAQAAAPAKVIPFRPRIVEPRPEERYVTCVPLVPLKAAAGAFRDPQHIEDDGWEWTAVD